VSPEARTTGGAVRGLELGTAHGAVHAFLGIPYAEPPVGDRRFARAVPARPWDGVRDSLAFGPAAMQAQTGPFAAALPGLGVDDMSEDCLTVNVWRPAAPGGPRPVLVWVPGGAYLVGGGAEPTYDGARLAAEQDVVVVSLNYRLGAFAFLDPRSLPDGGSASTNCGLWDVRLALDWVDANAGHFGGDSDRITGVGESAGAGCLIHLVSSPDPAPLRRVVALSPGVDFTQTDDLAAVATKHLLAAAGVGDLAALRALPAEQLVDAQTQAVGSLLFELGTMPFHPVIDRALLDATPSVAFADGRAASVDLMISSTTDELRLFPDPRADAMDDEALARWARADLTDRMAADPGDDVARGLVAHYRAHAAPERSSGGDVWTALQTDGRMRLPIERLAERHAASGGTTFHHQVAWQARRPGDPGAFHAMDLPFLFDALDQHGWAEFLGIDAAGRAAAQALREAVGSFAHTGQPASASIGPWPTYDAATRSTVVLGDEITVVDDPLAESRAAWDGLWSEHGRPPPVPL
jgi:para-nitrobenzyl esterase